MTLVLFESGEPVMAVVGHNIDLGMGEGDARTYTDQKVDLHRFMCRHDESHHDLYEL